MQSTTRFEIWMLSIKARLGILNERPWNLSIYKVPNKLRRLKEDAYNPHLVSIGPFHASNHKLVAMEEHKWRYMLHFLRRAAPNGTNYDEVTSPTEPANDQSYKSPAVKALEECGEAISGLEEMARDCYAENIDLDYHRLCETLLVDGCFILELFIKSADLNQDPIINNLLMVPTLQHDLALLENQIPFNVLQTLFDTIQNFAKEQFPFSLEEYVLRFFRSALNLSDKAIRETRLLHIADLLHRVVYTPPEKDPNPKKKIEWGFKKCATQLAKSGIQFQPGRVDEDCRLLDITFSEGVITIPQLHIQEITDSVFRNLIAFEQGRVGCSPHVTSYAWLMKTMILSSQDAELLRQKRIIITEKVGGDEEVSTFFESLCREVVVTEFCFSDLCEDVNKYKKSWSNWGRIKAEVKFHWDRIKAAVKIRWNRYILILHKKYFDSPWSILSFFAALVLLCLTALQTYYTVRPYYRH